MKNTKLITIGFILIIFITLLTACNVSFETPTNTTTNTTTHTDPIASYHEHTLVIDPKVNPTCTQTGLGEGLHCSDCGEVIIKQPVISVTEHTIVIDQEIPATCTQTGLTVGSHCSVCNTIIVTQQIIPLLPHEFYGSYAKKCINCGVDDIQCNHKTTEAVVGKSPTCTEIGYTDGVICKDCDTVISEQKTIPALGHGTNLSKVEATEPTFFAAGNIEHWYCSECDKCFNDKKATNEIKKDSTILPVIPSYTITFVDKYYYTDRTETFAQSISTFLNNSQYNPDEVLGYSFNGWYTSSGEKIEYISKGNTQDYILYASRDLINYTITYIDAPVNSNPTSYTINDEIIFSDPEWIGLSFKNWSNDENETVTKIEKGTVGDITLRANWCSEENLAIPTADNIPENILFDENENKYYFIYEIGIIDGIVVDTIESKYKNAKETLTFYKSGTVTLEENTADTIAKTISNSVSKTNGWNESKNWALSYQQSTEVSISTGIEGGTAAAKAKIEAGLSVSQTLETSSAIEYGKHSSNTSDSSSEESVSSYVAFAKGESTTVESGSTISPEMPKGTYHNVVVAKVTVYAIVTYDISTNTYYLDTYSVMDGELKDKRLYEAPVDCSAKIEKSDALDFTIPTDQIENTIKSSYYIKYNPNGGKGNEMYISVFGINETHSLSKNEYIRDGYTFLGWTLSLDGNTKTYPDGSKVSNLGNGGECIALYAQWSNNTYTIFFDPNGGSVSSKSQTVTYDKPYGTLPTPTRTGHEFKGWTVDGQYIDENTTFAHLENKTLVAQWSSNLYKVNYNPNGGSVSTNHSMVKFLDNYSLPTPSKADHFFLGWYYDDALITNSSQMKTAKEHTLVAKWIKSSSTWCSVSRDIKIKQEGYEEFLYLGLTNISALKKAGLTSITLTISIDGKESHILRNDDWFFEIYDRNGTKVATVDGSRWSNGWENKTYVITLSIDALRDDGSILIRYDTNKGPWHLGTVVALIVVS